MSIPQAPAYPSATLAVGIPTYGWSSTMWMKRTHGLVTPLGTHLAWLYLGTGAYGDPVRPTAEAENILIDKASKIGVKYLFLLETDVLVPRMAISALMRDMQLYPQATVVSGIVTRKAEVPEPMVFRGWGEGPYWDFRAGEVFWADAVQMGCTMIRMEDLEHVETEMVDVYDYPAPGEITPVREFFRTTSLSRTDVRTLKRETNDMFFCKRLREQGFEIWVDAGILCEHFAFETKTSYRMKFQKKEAGNELRVVNLGCGNQHGLIDGVKPLRVDLNESVKPDFRCDVRNLPDDWEGKFDIVYSSHMLEHFDRYEIPYVFGQMVRICKPGGEIRLQLPSMDWAIEHLAEGDISGRVMDVVWGGRSTPAEGNYPEMFHKMGLTRSYMKEMANKHNCKGKAENKEFNETYRIFKPPFSKEVEEWLNEDNIEFSKRLNMEEANG